MSAELLKVVQGVVADAGNVLIPNTEAAVGASLRAILDQRDEARAALAEAEREKERWLAWSGGQYPDDSPGDVIAAESDGTIILDDSVTTWNPLRALAFLSSRVTMLSHRADWIHPDDFAAARRETDTLAADLWDAQTALRWSKCTCWDHVCARCKTLDKQVPGWRDSKWAAALAAVSAGEGTG